MISPGERYISNLVHKLILSIQYEYYKKQRLIIPNVLYFSVYLTCTSLLFFTIWKSGLLEMKLSTHTAGLFLLQSIPTGNFDWITICREIMSLKYYANNQG